MQAAAQGLHGLQAAAQGLQGLHAAAQGLHGLQAAAQGLHGLHAAAHGLHGLQALARRGTTQSEAAPPAAQGFAAQGLQGLHAAAHGLQGLHGLHGLHAAAQGLQAAAQGLQAPQGLHAASRNSPEGRGCAVGLVPSFELLAPLPLLAMATLTPNTTGITVPESSLFLSGMILNSLMKTFSACQLSGQPGPGAIYIRSNCCDFRPPSRLH